MGSRDQHLGDFEHVVLLGIVRLGPDAYGTTIRQEIERRIGRAVSIGQIYSALNRLENKGFISSHVGDPSPVRGGRAKRYFKPNARGIEVLRRSREVLSLMWDGLDPQAL
jgi:PadR family transcriptional regulator PadR